MRDSQRTKCYQAEALAEQRLTQVAKGDRVDPVITEWFRVMDEGECTKFIHKVAKKIGVTVNAIEYPAAGNKATWFNGPKKVRLPRWARTKDTVIHELAHAVIGQAGPRGRHFPGPGHGAEWVEQRLILTALFGTDEIAAAFRKAYRDKAVRVVPSPEQAIAFLNMARRKDEPSERRIKVIMEDGVRYTGRLIEWDGETVTVGRRLSETSNVTDAIETIEDLSGQTCRLILSCPIEEVRYATFIDPDPELLAQ